MTPDDLVIELEDSDNSKTEPALLIGTGTTSVIGALYFIVKYLVPNISDELIYACMTILAILLPTVVGFITRNKVWSPRSVQKVVDQSVTNALQMSNLKNKPSPGNVIGELPRRDPLSNPDDFPPSLGHRAY